MYTGTSDDFNTKIASLSRSFTAKLILSNSAKSVTITEGIRSINYSGGSCGADTLTIVSAVASSVEIEVESSQITIEPLDGVTLTLSMGLVLDSGTPEYIPIGKFFITSVSKVSKETIKISACDAMLKAEKLYVSNLSYPATAIQMIDEICSSIGISRATTGLGTIRISEAPKGYTCREMLGYLAALYGKFAVINRTGKLEIRWYEDMGAVVDLDHCSQPTVSESSFTLEYLKVMTSKDESLSAGSGITGITVSNPFMTQDALNTAWNTTLNGFAYTGAEVNIMLADPRIDSWDLVTLETEPGKYVKVPCMDYTLKFDGGLSAVLKAGMQTKEEAEIDYKGPNIASKERIYAEIMTINTLLADKVSTEYLQAHYLTAEGLTAEYASISELKATKAEIEDLQANTLTAESAVIKQLQTEMLTANSAVIGDLQATAALFNAFSSIFGFTQNAQFINLTAANVTIDDAVIKDIIAKKITVADLITASAQAERIDIIKDGKASISFLGATQQFYDSEGNVRVQIGQAADGNFSFIVRGADGKTALFDENGITENAVPDGLIVDSMVSDNAHISGGKLDMQSLIEEINGSNYKLKTSTIAYDEDGQSLDLKFTELSESVTEIGTLTTEQGTKLDAIVETVTDQGTSLEVINSQINSKIWQNDITTATAGLVNETQLTSRLSEVNQTIDSITSTVSSMQTTINEKADGTTVTQISTQMAEVKQDLSGFKTTVSNTYATQDSLGGAMDFAMSQISSAWSEISQQADKIALKVNKDGVISAINQSAEEITIDASKIDLSGYVTFTAHQGAISGLSNAISSVSSTANSAKAWTDENGTNMTALRSMVMKWTNNAVSTSTYIQGGWIATHTITAEQMAIGLGGNIMLYGLDTFEMIAESTVKGLSTSRLASIGYDMTYKRYGEHSLKVVTDGAALCFVRLENSNIANDGIIPVSPDEFYVFSWYVRSTSHDSINMQGYVWKYDDDMSTQTGGFALTKRTLTGCKSGWVRYVSAPFKPGCNYMVLAMYINDASTAVTAYIDCLQLEQVQSTFQTASPWKPNQATVIDGGTIWANTIQGNSIKAGAITANKIAAKAVTADKISVTSLQAVSANIGGFKISSNQLISANSASFTYNNSTIYYLRTMLSPTGFGIMFDGEYSATTGVHGYDGYRLKIEGLTQGSTPYESAITVTGPGLCYIRSRSVGGTVTNLMRFAGSDAYNASTSLQYIYVYKSAYFASTISCTSLTERSDERLKTDINDMSDKYITLFDCLAPRTFRFKDDPTKLHTGFIAQELLSAIDESGLTADEVGAFVDVNKDGSEYHIAYTELTAILTAKIKQLENKIKNLEVQINENNSN